jgi:sulfate permease, SulP family
VRLFQSMRPFKRADRVRDAAAGITLAAMNIPQALGYTRIAGMPVVTGLYALLLPLATFGIFGSSRYLVVSADSATAAIFADGVAGMAPTASARYVALAGTVALLTAAALLLSRLLKLGFVADFLSQTVLLGFLTGVGFQVGIAVLGQMLGIPVSSHKTVIQLIQVCRGLRQTHLPTLVVSVLVLAAALLLSRLAPKVPGALLAVVGAIAASKIWNFSGHGIAIIGPVAGGLPGIHLPDVHWREIPPLIPIALSCSVMIVTQSAATARAYAARHRQQLDENADLSGLSAANAAAAFTGAFVVNGSPTQTAMVEGSGGQSQFAQVATAAVVAVVLLFLTKPLEYLPQCVLGALVFMVAIHLIDLRGLESIRSESPGEFALAVTTTLMVVVAGVEQGIVLAMILSLLRIVGHSYHPSTGVMVRADTGGWNLLPVTPGAVTEPGFVIYRFGAPLFYANANRFCEEVTFLTKSAPSPVRWLVIDCEAIAHIDYSAARAVLDVWRSLANDRVVLAFARVSWDLRSDFDRHHVTEAIGQEHIYRRLRDALSAFEQAQIP